MLGTVSHFLQTSRLALWLDSLPAQLIQAAAENPHGRQAEWRAILDALPEISASSVDFNSNTMRIGVENDTDVAVRERLMGSLKSLIPWRKGPYKLFGIPIDTEWRSDWKWERVFPYLSPLDGRLVLDVGCGSGYHMWRMYGSGAEAVIGIDPTLLFLAQFQLIKHYAGEQLPVWMLPLKSENLPDFHQKGFDTVFSMGVLYHRRDPLGHLQELRRALRAGGELVLETLVVAGDEHTALMPHDRYAKMRNVWFIPSVPMLELWLKRLGFAHIRVVDVTTTTVEEQRCTPWSKGESLADFLDPADSSSTVEGYPAPVRATVLANAPG
nr:tRNA 5-methoxyuridine(34)/uridine 5-oxyacetic acid(34) synthase CmoB [Thiothrix nivea]